MRGEEERMLLFEWSDAFCVGITVIDGQHKKLVGLLNELHAAMSRGQATKILTHLFDELVAYTQTHFAAEEALMATHGYPDGPRKVHLAEHAALTHKALELQKKYKAGGLVSIETSEFLRDWLAHHIQGIDHQLGDYLASKGVQ
jgi:hemerythrin-like metal-binding protein